MPQSRIESGDGDALNRLTIHELSETASGAIARRILFVAAVVSALAALLLATTNLQLGQRWLLVGCFVATSALSLLAARWSQAAAQWAVLGVSVVALALVAVYGLLSGLGFNAPAIGFLTLLPMVICVAVGSRAGIVTAMATAVALMLLAWAEHRGWIGGATVLAELPLPRRLANHLLLVGAGLACGLTAARTLTVHRRASEEREARFTHLLGIAVDTYWELDDASHTTTVWRRDGDNRFVKQARAFPAPWERPEWGNDATATAAHIAALDARRSFRDLPSQWRRRDGTIRHELISGEPRFDAQGRFVGFWGVGRDITADLQLKQAVRESEARYRDLFDVAPLALVIHRYGRVIEANAAAAALFGYADPPAMKGQDLLAHLGPEERDRSAARERAVLAGERVPPAVYRWVTHDGRRPVLRANATRLEIDGQYHVLAIFEDISELHHAQEALQRSEATLSHLVATSPDLITLTDMDTGVYVMVNDTFTRLTGYTREQAIGHTAIDLGVWADPRDREPFIEALRHKGSVSNWPHEFVSRNGETFILLLSAAQFELEGRRYVVLNGRDISETERTRLAHEAVLQNASLGIAFTREQKILQANPALEQMLGWERGTLAGQPGRAVWPGDADYAEVGQLIGPLLAHGESVEFVRELKRRDDTVFWCRLLAKAVNPSHPLRGGTIWIVEDITERRRTEQALAKARDEAEAASRAKSAFLANMSHEIRTPLNGLIGLARLARLPEMDEARRRQYLDQIGDSAETLAAVIADVLDLSKIEAGKLTVDTIAFDLTSLLQALGRVYGALADARGLSYDQRVEPELPRRVMGDPVRLRQILTNYLNNALKFTAHGGVELRAEMPRAGWLRVEVVDTGPGIEADVQARLFRPFQQADSSTTRRFGGTGLGLSICRELAELMHGQVGVSSTPGRGSCFWVELPLEAADPDAPDTAWGDDVGAESLSGSRVLMTEDNAVNMTIAVAMLEQWGVQVSQATDGAQAVRAVVEADRAARPFDAVLMDVQMPVMSGYEATRQLRQLYDAETLPIIALTAAALTSERELALQAGMNDFLTKPIDVQRLRDTLTATLDARRAARRLDA
jgi:PAS domain S-box-containing protein